MNKNKLFFAGIFFVVLMAALVVGCTKDEGKVPVEAAPVSGCDTITYTKHIKPIIDASCALSGCHAGTTSNPLLTSYDLVKEKAERVKSRAVDANPSIMPPSPNTPLTAEQKQLVTCWLENGKKE